MKSKKDAALLHWAELQIKLYGTEVYDEYYDGLKPKYRVFKMEDGTLVDDCFVLRPVANLPEISIIGLAHFKIE